MPEHDIDRQLAERRIEIRKLVHMHQEFDMPAEWFDALGKPGDALDRELSLTNIHDIESGTANSRQMHRFKFTWRCGFGDNSDAAERRACDFHGSQHGGIVGTVETRLHQHRTTTAERVKHAAVFW